METLQAILRRRSVREYREDPIPRADLRRILEAGRQAPSAGNRQPWHFLVVGDREQRRKLARACDGQTWIADAAYILVAVGMPHVSPKWYAVDVAIALENIVLAACSLGYGTCWVGAFDADLVKSICRIPVEATVVACTPLGVPVAWPEPRDRKPWGEVFSGDRYGEPVTEPSV